MSTDKKEYRSIESIRLEAELSLADYMFENEIISESAYKLQYVGSSSQTLLENSSRQNAPAYYYDGKLHYVSFRNVWNNIRDYQTIEDVYRVFHPDHGQIAKNTATNWAGRVLKKFLGEGNSVGVPEARKELIAKSTKERSAAVENSLANQVDEYEDEFGPMSVDGGYERKSSRSGNIERASTLFPGDVYSDQSRIPKRRWGSWWKRFLRKQTNVADPESSIASMRKWTKHFIMGYQISPQLFFEIWYNSMDSTFSVHDKYGNVVRQGGSIPLIRDALNILFHNVADVSPMDAQVLNMRSPDLRRMNQDIARALSGEVDTARSYAERMRDRKEKIIDMQKQEEERNRQKAEQRDRAAAEERGGAERAEEEETDNGIKQRMKTAAKDAAKNAAKSAVKKGVENYKTASAERYAKDKEGTEPSSPDSYGDDARKAAERRAQRQSGVDVDADAKAQEERQQADQRKREQEDEEKRLAAEQDLKDEIEKAEQELADIRSDASYDDMGEVEKKALRRELEAELKDMEKAAEELEDGDFDSKLKRELQKIERKAANRSAKKRYRRKKKEDEDETPDVADYDAEISGGRSKKRSVNESLEEQDNPFDEFTGGDVETVEEPDMTDYEENPLYRVKANQEVQEVRQKAENSQFTRQLINSMFLEGFVQVYDQTRVRDNRTFVRRIFDRLKLFRGRVDKVALPTRVVSTYMRMKGFFGGAQARADFIIGYTINDVANFEIWYVQEISKDGTQQIASFYLYDVTAMKVLERNVPHYRNAIQMLILKIGSEDTKGV